VNLPGDNIDTIKKNTETLIDASKKVGLEVNAEKSMLMSHHQNTGQNHDIKLRVANILRKCGTVLIFGNDSNKSNFDLGGN
jgi:hypothetical protein